MKLGWFAGPHARKPAAKSIFFIFCNCVSKAFQKFAGFLEILYRFRGNLKANVEAPLFILVLIDGTLKASFKAILFSQSHRENDAPHFVDFS